MKNLYLLLGVVMVIGCSVVDSTQEVSKTMWGSSIRALEEARAKAIIKNFQCDFKDCFDQILTLHNPATAVLNFKDWENIEDLKSSFASTDEEAQPMDLKMKKFYFFIKDPIKKHIVVMDIPGSVDTTEVGIFFVPISDKNLRVEVASLSSRAKRTVSEIVFTLLDEKFGEVKDPTIHK